MPQTVNATRITPEQARDLLRRTGHPQPLGLSISEFIRGLQVEGEHWGTFNKRFPRASVLEWFQYLTDVVLDHLMEDPSYYSKLSAAGL